MLAVHVALRVLTTSLSHEVGVISSDDAYRKRARRPKHQEAGSRLHVDALPDSSRSIRGQSGEDTPVTWTRATMLFRPGSPVDVMQVRRPTAKRLVKARPPRLVGRPMTGPFWVQAPHPSTPAADKPPRKACSDTVDVESREEPMDELTNS